MVMWRILYLVMSGTNSAIYNSPTRFCEKNDMGSFTKLLYNETLRFAKYFFSKLTNKDNLKKKN
jgi:hypothetical protein